MGATVNVDGQRVTASGIEIGWMQGPSLHFTSIGGEIQHLFNRGIL
jgi:hypothetical protein